jgi:hypothetical protein
MDLLREAANAHAEGAAAHEARLQAHVEAVRALVDPFQFLALGHSILQGLMAFLLV